MATPYRRGADFERAVRRHLQGRGYLCWRVAGSKGEGCVDLIAFSKKRGWVLIQCKINGKISLGDHLTMLETAAMTGATPVLVFKSNRKIWVKKL